MNYETIQRFSSVKCDGGDPNSEANLIFTGPVLPFPSTAEYVAQYLELANHSGGAVNLGVGVRFPKRWWGAGQWVNATPAFTDDTTDAQDAGTNDFPLETLTNNDGFVVYSDRKFNLINLLVGVASVTGTPVRVVKFSNGSGRGASQTGDNLLQGPITSAHWTAGEHVIWWEMPAGWELTTGHANEGGLPVGVYAVLIQSTTAPTGTAGAASTMSVHHVPFTRREVADNAIVTFGASDKGFSLGHGEGVSVAFSVAGAQNAVRGSVRARG